MEIRLQDLMLSDCLAVIQWYHYLIEVKFARALMSQEEEKEEQQNPYDSLGNAKLLLVSIERNISAWVICIRILEKMKTKFWVFLFYCKK
jgi:hypothetical protein